MSSCGCLPWVMFSTSAVLVLLTSLHSRRSRPTDTVASSSAIAEGPRDAPSFAILLSISPSFVAYHRLSVRQDRVTITETTHGRTTHRLSVRQVRVTISRTTTQKDHPQTQREAGQGHDHQDHPQKDHPQTRREAGQGHDHQDDAVDGHCTCLRRHVGVQALHTNNPDRLQYAGSLFTESSFVS